MKIFLLIVSMITLFFGAIFKIQHWPNADATLVIGLILFATFHIMVIRAIVQAPVIRYGTRIMWLALSVSLPYLGSILFLSFHSGETTSKAK